MSAFDLHRETLALTGVLMESLEGGREHRELKARLTNTGIDLLEAVALGEHHENLSYLDEADELLTRLGAQMALAHALGVLSKRDYLDLCHQADLVGRGLGRALRP